MARYINADKFIAELEQEKTAALEFGDGVAAYEIEHTMNLISMQPTADVVPKSEVDREIKAWQKLYADTVSKWEKAYEELEIKLENAKAEVATEIFEEIEKILIDSAYIPDCAKFVDIDKLAELEKKYVVEIPIVRDLAEEAVDRDITNKQNEE